MKMSLVYDSTFRVEKCIVVFVLASGEHGQIFRVIKEIACNPHKRSSSAHSVARAQMINDALDKIGSSLLKQVESGKIGVIENNKLVKHDLSPDWTIK